MLPEQHKVWQEAHLEARCCWYVESSYISSAGVGERYEDGETALGEKGKINRTGDWESPLQGPTAETQPQEQMSRAFRTSEELRRRLSGCTTGSSTARRILKGEQLLGYGREAKANLGSRRSHDELISNTLHAAGCDGHFQHHIRRSIKSSKLGSECTFAIHRQHCDGAGLRSQSVDLIWPFPR